MPKVTISKPFNFRHGSEVKRYKVGAQDVPQPVADHAKANGFLEPQAQAKPAPKGETKQ